VLTATQEFGKIAETEGQPGSPETRPRNPETARASCELARARPARRKTLHAGQEAEYHPPDPDPQHFKPTPQDPRRAARERLQRPLPGTGTPPRSRVLGTGRGAVRLSAAYYHAVRCLAANPDAAALFLQALDPETLTLLGRAAVRRLI